MFKKMLALSLLVFAALFGGFSSQPKAVTAANSVSVYGAWHCGNDFCTWSSVRNMTDFNTRNQWLINRGDGTPSVNLVVLSFVHPLRLLNKTNDAGTSQGIPIGMNQAVVDYFKTRGVRVQLSIGGITYTDAWNQALATNPVQLGLNAAEAAQRLGVGIEIDYEENTNPNLTGLTSIYQCVSLGSALRRFGKQSCSAIDDRSRRRRSLVDCFDAQSYG